MRPFFGLLASLLAIAAAAYLIFDTVVGAQIGSMLGTAIYWASRMELSLFQLAGLRSITFQTLIYVDCAIIGSIAVWRILVGLRTFDDIFYKTLLNGSLGMLVAASVWVLKQAAH